MKLVLCLSLLVCIFGASFAQTLGGFQDMSESDYNSVLPKLRSIFERLSSEHNDFDVIFKRIQSGKYQTVGGTNYEMKVETARKSNANEAQLCDVHVLENLQGEFDQVDVKCEDHDKTFRYTKQ